MSDGLPLVQLALDFQTVEEALAAAELGVAAGVDILEAGTPLIVAQGVSAIGRLARAFPDYEVLADYKTMDSGFRNVQHTQAQGGHLMTVCANAADETVRSAIDEGRKLGIQVVVDTIGVKHQWPRIQQCVAWGADMIYLHFGADQRRANPDHDTLPWLLEIRELVEIPIGVATFGIDDAVRAAEAGADLVAIGHPVVSSPRALQELTDYVREVKSRFRPRPRPTRDDAR